MTARRADGQVRLEERERGPQARQGLRRLPGVDRQRQAGRAGGASIIALPLHLHAPAAIAAMQAGLHVITENSWATASTSARRWPGWPRKPSCTWPPAISGTTTSSTPTPMDTIQRGLLGDLHYIRAQWHRSNLPGTDSWQQPLPPGQGGGQAEGRLARKLARSSWTRRAATGRAPAARTIDVLPEAGRARSRRRSPTTSLRSRALRQDAGRNVRLRKTPQARRSTTARPSRS